ncbi:MAG: integrase [bacterium]
MAEIFHFVPLRELKAEENLKNFIQRCKYDLKVFGAELDWDNWQWKGYVNFTKIGVKSRGVKEEDYLHWDFMDFAKAYLRYLQGHKSTVARNELRALRSVEKALIQVTGGALISDLSITVLDEAANIAKRFYSKGADYHAGREIERLVNFVSQNNLIASDLEGWKNPIARKKDEIQTGQKAKERRGKMLPSDDVLDAMAKIFALDPKSNKDIFTSSVFAMLMCAPSRITEVLELPYDCETEIPDKNGKVQYGWRFYSGKGFGGDIKWIPSEMVEVAKESIRRIKKITEEPRKLAKWIEDNPGKFYHHGNCPVVADDALLNPIEAARALGLVCDSIHSAQSSLSGIILNPSSSKYSLNTLWKYVMNRQPEGIPWLIKEKKVKYGNALFCMTRNMLNNHRGTSPVILWHPSVNVFNFDLSSRESLHSETHKSIFDRYRFLDKDSNHLKATSHQVRHLLSTIAERGGLSQQEIAKWAGRANPTQNRTYNHMSEYEMVSIAEQLDTSLSLFGPVGAVAKHIPITVQEFNILEKGPVHITEYGICVHDYTMSPCEKYRDCINCSEQVYIKGDKERLRRIKLRFLETEKQVEASEIAINDGLAGADRWYEYHKNTLNHLRELVYILENADIPDGSQIKLENNKAFSILSRAINSKLTNPKGINLKEKNMLENMTKLLGGGLG